MDPLLQVSWRLLDSYIRGEIVGPIAKLVLRSVPWIAHSKRSIADECTIMSNKACLNTVTLENMEKSVRIDYQRIGRQTTMVEKLAAESSARVWVWKSVRSTPPE